MSKRRVVVTGLGMVTPVGNDVKTTWNNIVNGKSGIANIDHFDVSAYNTRFGGSIRDFDVTQYMPAKDARKMDVFIQYGMAASMQALADSGLEITEQNAGRVGCAIGSGIGGVGFIEKNHIALQGSGPRKISPFFVPGCIINMIAGNLSIKYGLKGPNIAITTACTTGTHSIGSAARMIAYGDADAMVAGGAEMASTPLGLGGFSAARALSTRNDDPQRASRPFDMDRDGFVLSNGAGCVVLEELEHAKARGATIYAELLGFGMSGDAYHITTPPEDGEGARKAMVAAMRDAGVEPEDIDYVNAHGTSTPAGDVGETVGIRRAFGDAAERLMVSSTKSTTGHLLGAAGVAEAIFCVQALRDQVVPPTINLDNQDPACDLDCVPLVAREARLRKVISNSFGFGGTNSSLIFGAFEG